MASNVLNNKKSLFFPRILPRFFSIRSRTSIKCSAFLDYKDKRYLSDRKNVIWSRTNNPLMSSLGRTEITLKNMYPLFSSTLGRRDSINIFSILILSIPKFLQSDSTDPLSLNELKFNHAT